MLVPVLYFANPVPLVMLGSNPISSIVIVFPLSFTVIFELPCNVILGLPDVFELIIDELDPPAPTDSKPSLDTLPSISVFKNPVMTVDFVPPPSTISRVFVELFHAVDIL